MKGERPLFPNNQLVSDETRKKWRERVDYLLEEDHASRLNDWEAGFVQDMEQRLANGRDLSLAQSYRLNEIFHRIEEAVG
jgi:hypothetical protein